MRPSRATRGRSKPATRSVDPTIRRFGRAEGRASLAGMTDERDDPDLDLDLDGIRRTLEAELESLRTMSDAASDQRAPVELDQQSVGRLSRMDAMQVQAMAQAVDGRRRARALQIAAALKRLDAGDYGYWAAGSRSRRSASPST